MQTRRVVSLSVETDPVAGKVEGGQLRQARPKVGALADPSFQSWVGPRHHPGIEAGPGHQDEIARRVRVIVGQGCDLAQGDGARLTPGDGRGDCLRFAPQADLARQNVRRAQGNDRKRQIAASCLGLRP